MLRKIGFSILCAAATLNSNVYSSNHTLQPGLSLEYILAPNKPETFINYMYWEVEANCIITTEDEGNELFAEALAKQGKVNDVELTMGNSMHVIVHNGETLKIAAKSGAKVRITNLGQHTVKATCST